MFKDQLDEVMANISLSLDQYGPEISFWTGLGLMTGGAVWAVVKALKRVPEIKDEYRIANKSLEVETIVEGYTFEQELARVKQIKRERNWNYVKAFSGPTIMFVTGAIADALSFIEIDNRWVEVSGELVGTTAAFTAYRQRTAALIGEEQEKALYYNKELKTREVEDEDGNVKTEYYLEDNGQQEVPHDPYTYEWSPETSDMCQPGDDMHEYNLATLYTRQEEWTRILGQIPAVYLNDVLRALGLVSNDAKSDEEETVASRRAGWLNPKYYKTNGAGYVDFRVTPVRYTASDGRQRWKYMLNFNCDGDIEAMILNQKGLYGHATRLIDRPKEN